MPKTDKHGPKTSSPIISNENLVTELNKSFSNTFFAGATEIDKNILNKAIRRSNRLSILTVNNQLNFQNNTISSDVSNQSFRRSSRKSVLKYYDNKRNSLRAAYHRGRISLGSLKKLEAQKSPAPTTHTNTKSASKKETSDMKIITNNVITLYSGTPCTTAKKSVQKHRKDILNLLNKGSIKDIKILPQIGQKTAFQIIAQRYVYILNACYFY